MRAVCLFVVALGAWGAWPGVQAQPGGDASRPVVVIVDGDTPAADPRAAARLRDAVLQPLDGATTVTWFELTAEGLRAVGFPEAQDFRRTVFTITPPRYNGVGVSFAEAVEVLRGNEQMRNELVGRECPAAPDCAARVRVAVTEEVKRAEAAGARKLRALAAQASGWRGTRVVLFTSGWPVRDEGRVDVDRAVRDLRAQGTTLVVVRVPPVAPYRGLVRDAAESLAARLPARFLTLADDADVAPASAVILENITAAATAAGADVPAADVPAAEAVPSAPPPDVPPDGAPPIAPSGASAASRGVSASVGGMDATLRRAAQYVAAFERTFTEVVWHERYEQENRVWRRFGSSGARTAVVAGRRRLESELFFAWLPQDGTWISVRDVLTVDGAPRPVAERRLPRLSSQPSVSLPELRDLARENGRFNLGGIVRTFNEPTLALLFLDERYRARVAWSRKGARVSSGHAVVTYAFEEQGSPTVIRSLDRDVPAHGTLDIDETTGQIWASSIEVSDASGSLTGRMAVDYQPHVSFDVLVPREMRETYTARLEEEVTATATYSDFRRFQTKSRLILTPGR